MPARLNIVGILLAAGRGSRFGGGKLLHALPDGTPIGVASLRNLRSALPDVVAVVRADDTQLRRLLEQEGVAVHLCTDADEGMARSLVCGIKGTRDAAGWVIALGDMPYLLPQTIRTVARHVAQSDRIAVPAYRGSRGHPVGFSHRYLNELIDLHGDEGARSVIKRHPDAVETVECDDSGVLRDIDTPEDLSPPGS